MCFTTSWLLVQIHAGFRPNSGSEVALCATFGPLRNIEHFLPVSDSCMGFYLK